MTDELNQYLDKEYSNLVEYCRGITRSANYADDVVNDVVVTLLQMNRRRVIEILRSGKLSKYLHRAIYVQCNCGDAYYVRKYRLNKIVTPTHELPEVAAPSLDIDLIDIEDWFSREVMRLKIEGYTAQEISDMTGITKVNIDRTISQSKKQLLKKL